MTVNGLTVGTSTITVRQAPGTVYAKQGSTSYNIDVATSKTESQLRLSSSSGSITAGKDIKVEISTTGDGKITCASKDEKIATCSIEETTLTIKGLDAGTTTISVSQEEGDAKLAPAGVTYEVEVKVPKTPAAKIISEVVGLKDAPYGKIYNSENPYNYILFNNEQWRIIGVYGNNLKIVRAEPIKLDQVFNKKNGGNAWSESKVKNYLYSNYETIISDKNSRDMVLEDAKWYIGSSIPQKNASNVYSDAKKEEWTGKIGLITSYEYQYATKSSCWTTRGDEYGKSCGSKNWLYKTVAGSFAKDGAWTMTADKAGDRALRVHPNMFVDDNPVDSTIAISPVVYLKENVTITEGNGKTGNEFKLELIETQ